MNLSRTNPLWRWLAGGLVVAGLATLAIRHQGEPEREVRSMPETERRVVYQRTLETLKGLCLHAAGPTLKEYCREQVEFIVLFPECDHACRALVLQLTPSATR